MTSLPPANELWEGCVFTGVCDSVQGEGRAWQERRPLQRASTGMHSCLIETCCQGVASFYGIGLVQRKVPLRQTKSDLCLLASRYN